MTEGPGPGAGTEIIVDIESLAPGGDAVGRQQARAGADPGQDAADGRVTFVPLAAPGERVRAHLEREKGKVAWAELAAIERPGPDRIPPPCPLFGACGGCQWQHVTLAAQHQGKRAAVERALGGVSIPPVVAASPAYGYRDRARLAVGPGGLLGFRARRSHELVDVEACLLFGPELTRALPALRALARGLAPGVELDVQAGREGVHLNVVRADPTSAAHARREVDRLAAAGVAGLALGGKPTWGLPEVDVAEPGSAHLAVPAGGFAQVGRAATGALVAAVLEAVGPAPGVVRELYAGSGTLTRALAARAQVFAEDGDPAAVERGRRSVPGATWARTPARPGPDAPPADTVVLDPPREGADRAHLDRALAARRRVVYVSCDPQTLGRDLRALVAGGFRLAGAVGLDLMPQTFHVEVVATLDRG